MKNYFFYIKYFYIIYIYLKILNILHEIIFYKSKIESTHIITMYDSILLTLALNSYFFSKILSYMDNLKNFHRKINLIYYFLFI